MELSTYHPFRSAIAKERYLASYDQRAKRWPLTSETRMVETSYGQTFVRISGEMDAPPLVLLPGFGASSLLWVPNIEALSASYRTYAVDSIYDFGRSVYSRHLKGSGDFVNWLDELFNGLALGNNINLMGLSYGGWLTCQYALRFPNRLAKIVLLAPGATVLPMRLEFMLRGYLSWLPHRKFVRRLMCWIFEDWAHKDSDSRKLVEEIADHRFLASRCFTRRAFTVPTVLGDKELQSIKVPALYLVGENEKIYSAQKAIQRLNTVAPQIRTEIIPQAGHDLTYVQSELVNKKVLEFLNQP